MSTHENTYVIKKIDAAAYADWDRFVFSAAGGTLFHTARWAKVIEHHFQRSFKILTVQKADDTVGGMIIWPKTMAGITMITHPPATRYQGMLVRAPESDKPSSRIAHYHAVLAPLIAYLKEHYAYTDITLAPFCNDMRPLQWHGFEVQPAYTYLFTITQPEELKRQFSQALRRKYNKAEKEGLTVARSSQPADLIRFIRESYAHHNIKPPIPFDSMPGLFKTVLDQDIGHLFYLQEDGRQVAGLLLLSDAKGVYAYFSGMDQTRRRQNDTDYLHAKALQDPDFAGKVFDFLGSNTAAFEQFKRSFGGQLQTYYRARYFRNQGIRWLTAIRLKQMRAKRKL
ncbi:MAG: GNAT family N-acetyltransferase [Caldithrix sp.]|nr:GNAT family N-acetyltransferase [Caldithrix sp.]